MLNHSTVLYKHYICYNIPLWLINITNHMLYDRCNKFRCIFQDGGHVTEPGQDCLLSLHGV